MKQIQSELIDYAGPLKPDLKLEDFSKEMLIRLVKVAQLDFVGQDAIWFTAVKNKFGEATAREISEGIWAKTGAPAVRDDFRRTCPAFNLKGNDIETLMKFLQVSPTIGTYQYRLKCELKDKNHGTLTVTHCPSLLYWEKNKTMDVAEWGCGVVDPGWIQEIARLFNPKIKVVPTRHGARKSPDDFPCQYELTLQE